MPCKKEVILFVGSKSFEILIDFDENKIYKSDGSKLFNIAKVDNNIIYLEKHSLGNNLVLAFDNKFAFLSTLDSPYLVFFQPMSIWEMPTHKALFFEVAKNACTSVLTNIYLSEWKQPWSPSVTSDFSIWDVLFWQNHYFRTKMLVTKQDYLMNCEKFSHYIKFLVYDDPVKRFLRMANNKYIEHHEIASSLKFPYDKNISDFIDKLLLIIQLDCLNTKSWDQHLAPISLIGKSYLDDITDFVYLSDLDSFFLKKFNIHLPRLNAMPSDKKYINENSLQTYQLVKIKEIYSADYLIPIKYEDKFFRC